MAERHADWLSVAEARAAIMGSIDPLPPELLPLLDQRLQPPIGVGRSAADDVGERIDHQPQSAFGSNHPVLARQRGSGGGVTIETGGEDAPMLDAGPLQLFLVLLAVQTLNRV